MPKEAIRLGAVDRVVPLLLVPAAICSMLNAALRFTPPTR
jgi:chemotaxis response regulator CheB